VNDLLHYYLVIQSKDSAQHANLGIETAQALAYAEAYAEAYANTLRRDGYTVRRWPDVPVWDAWKLHNGVYERFGFALYESEDSGEDGGSTSPFDDLPGDALELPKDVGLVHVWWN
jgi:hypothetical protein